MINARSSQKNPVLKSVLYTVAFLLVVGMGGAISAIAGIDSKITLFIAYLMVAVVLGFFLSKRNRWNELGFRFAKRDLIGNLCTYIPLYLMAILPLLAGVEPDLGWMDIGYVLVFMAIVGFVEETIFRGVVLKSLQAKGDLVAILGSSLLFSIPHILNALNGKEWGQTLFQITFALLMGIILALLMIRTENIVPLVVYHFLNNTFGSITRNVPSASLSFAINAAVFAIGILFALYLFLSRRSKYN